MFPDLRPFPKLKPWQTWVAHAVIGCVITYVFTWFGYTSAEGASHAVWGYAFREGQQVWHSWDIGREITRAKWADHIMDVAGVYIATALLVRFVLL